MWGFLSYLALSLSAANAGQAHCNHPWVFFDLGNTLLELRDKGEKIRYMPGAQDYLKALHKKGYRLGLIVNIPENWGQDREAKISALKKHVTEHWTGPKPMDWAVFSRILVPSSDADRKPSPALFEEAARLAKDSGCKAIFQGETPREVAIANQLGLTGFEVGRPSRFFLPLPEIQNRLLPNP